MGFAHDLWDGEPPDDDSNRVPDEARFVRHVAIVMVPLVAALVLWFTSHPDERDGDVDFCTGQPYSAEQC